MGYALIRSEQLVSSRESTARKRRWSEFLADAEAVVVAIYIDSWIFVFATAIIQFGFGVDFSFPVCDSAILLCLLCYVSSKVCCEGLLRDTSLFGGSLTGI